MRIPFLEDEKGLIITALIFNMKTQFRAHLTDRAGSWVVRLDGDQAGIWEGEGP